MHLKAESALDLLEQRLDKDQERFWNQHLQDCSKCAKEIDRWREIRSGLKRLHLQTASTEDMENAVRLFRSTAEAGGSKLRHIIANIVFDSFVQPALAGARGADASRQLVLHSEILDIHVKVWGERHQKQLMGQLLLHTRASFAQETRCHLMRNGKRLKTTTVEELGEFHFTSVPEGNLTLEIDFPSLTITGPLNLA